MFFYHKRKTLHNKLKSQSTEFYQLKEKVSLPLALPVPLL